MNSLKKRFALLLALSRLFALTACGGDSDSDADTSDASASESTDVSDSSGTEDSEGGDTTEVDYSDPIVIGHIADLTGTEASTGLLASAALQFAVDYFNSIGGVNGRALTIAEQDAQSDSTVAATAAQALVESSGASVILGPTQTGHKSAVAAYVSGAGVPAVYYNGTPEDTVSENEYVIGLGGSTNQMPTAMAAYLYEEMGYRTIVTLTYDNAGGYGYMNPLIEAFEALGGTVIDSLWMPFTESDTSTYMTTAATAGADCIVAWLSGSHAISLWTQWYEQGVYETTPMSGCSHGGYTDYFVWKALYYSGQTELVETALEQGVYVPITYTYSVDNEMNKAMLEYYASYDLGEDADTYCTFPVGSNMFGAVFAAVQAVVEAMETLEDPTDSEALYQALQNTDTVTPEGNLTIDSSRIATKDIHIVKVVQLEDGTFNYEVVKTYESVPVSGYTG
ncbi:MAG: ABC transporter substrate-binding protein [Oscillospiraceae bacterium]|nr:ABC transporter substrate-binding protein [Oscillospiraceae bacterium]